jgi:hypothetical protein
MRSRAITSLLMIGWLAPCAAGAGNAGLQGPVIRHTALTSFKRGDHVIFSANAPGARWVRLFFRAPGVETFQVRRMEKTGGDGFSYEMDTNEIAGASFDYYLEAERNGETGFYPPGAPSAFLTAAGEGGAEVPAVPQNLPPPEVPKAAVSWPVNVTGSVQTAFYENIESAIPKDTQGAGNVRVAANYQKEGLSVAFDSNLSYSNTPVAGEKDIDLSNMALAINLGGHSLRAGDVNITESEFTIQGLGRRGLEYAYGGSSASVHVFDISSQQPRGFDGFGIPKASLGIYGGALGYKLFKDAVSIRAVYLAGKDDPRQGVNVGESSFASVARQGSVVSVIEETTLFQNKLSLGGEFARSHFDGDLSDESGSRSDDAWRLGGAFRSGIFQAGAIYRFIGKAFNPIGFQYFTSDRRAIEGNAGLTAGSVNLMGSFAVARDNVKNDPGLDTTEIRNGNMNLVWTASPKISLSLGYQANGQSTTRDLGDPFFPQDSRTNQLSGGLVLTPSQAVNLNFQVGNSDVSSRTSPQANSRGFNMNVGGAFRAGEAFSVSPSIGYTTARNKFTGEKQITLNTFLAAELALVPQWLSTSFQGGYTRADNGSMGVAEQTGLSGLINVHLKKLIKVGTVILSVRGNYGRTKMPGYANTISSAMAQCDFSF